jgi:hypothetical protein
MPLVIASIAGLIVILQFFVTPVPELTAAKDQVLRWASITAAFGLIVGAIGTAVLQFQRLKSKESLSRSRALSGLTLAIMVLWIILGVSFKGFTASPEYVMIFNNVIGSLAKGIRAAAFFGCLMGAYVAFRVDNLESGVMFTAASIYLIRGLAIGQNVPGIVPVADWIASVPNVGATRGGIIAVAVGSLILAVRVYTGRERSVEEMVAEA